MRLEPSERKILELLSEKGEALSGLRTRRGPGEPTVDEATARAMADRGLLRRKVWPDNEELYPVYSLAELGRAAIAGYVDRLEESIEELEELEEKVAAAREDRNARIVALVDDGLPMAGISRIVGVSPERVRQWAETAREETR